MMRVLLLLGVALLSLAASGCVSRGYDDDRYYRNGPPPHAPSHGYRVKHHHQDMVYDARLGAYVVRGYRDYYYHNGRYFRYDDGRWQSNNKLSDRNWRHVDRHRVPEGLRYSKQYYQDRDHRDYRDKRSGRDYDDRRDKRYDRDDDRSYKKDKKRAKKHDDRDDRSKGRSRNKDRDDDWDD